MASQHLGDDRDGGPDGSLVQAVKQDYPNAAISAKLKALLAVAGSVQQGGKHVTTSQIDAARMEGATDRDIHDTVLIAAAFCLFNRYVDGLATTLPPDDSYYHQRAPLVAAHGYR